MKLSNYLLLAALFLNTSAFAGSKLISNFDDLLVSLKNGNDVKAIVHYDNCLPKSDKPTAQPMVRDKNSIAGIIGSMKINDFNYSQVDGQANKFKIMAENDAWVEAGNRRTSRTMTVTNSMQLEIYNDNTAEVYIAAFAPTSHYRYYFETYTCQLSNGNDNKGLFLYEKV